MTHHKQLHFRTCWKMFFSSNFSRCLCTKWPFPLHGWSFGNRSWCCICVITWFDVLTSNYRFGSWSLFNVLVWRSVAFQRILIVWHTKNRSQSWKSSKLWIAEVWPSQFVSTFYIYCTFNFILLHTIVLQFVFFYSKIDLIFLQSYVNLHGHIEHLHSDCEHTHRTRR